MTLFREVCLHCIAFILSSSHLGLSFVCSSVWELVAGWLVDYHHGVSYGAFFSLLHDERLKRASERIIAITQSLKHIAIRHGWRLLYCLLYDATVEGGYTHEEEGI
jgi:hypothetical protein